MSLTSSNSSPHDWPQSHWRVVMITAVTGLLFGIWGYRIYFLEQYSQASLLSCIYYTVQLFGLRMPQLTGHINLPLEISRWVTALAASLTVITLLRRVISNDLRHVGLLNARGHIVVCGLGEVGLRLALELKKNKRKVVAIERDATAPGVMQAESKGVTVILGDAKDPDTLRRARVHHAAKVLALCTEDDANIAIATAVRNFAQSEKTNQKEQECLLLVADLKLHQEVASILNPPNRRRGFLIKVGGLNVPDNVARQVFEEHPLDFDGISENDPDRVHLVIIGTCDLAEALAVKALQLCHFANRSRLRLTVVGNDAADFLKRLKERHPYSDPWYDSSILDYDRDDPVMPEKVAALPAPHEFVTIAICTTNGDTGDAESLNFHLALDIKKAMQFSTSQSKPPSRSQILVHFRKKSGFGKLLRSMIGLPSVHAFGLLEASYNRDTLLLETQDTIAKAFHKEYTTNHELDLWGEIPDELRDSNRQAADHIPIKLRAIGLCMADKGNNKPANLPVFKMSDKNVEPDSYVKLLAEMEHSRWCAERFLLKWREGKPKNTINRINPDLVPWVDLDIEERRKDCQQVNVIPSALDGIPKKIVKCIRIGVTGHCKIENPKAVAKVVHKILKDKIPEWFDKIYLNGDRLKVNIPIQFRIFTSLAEGADRIVAKEALKMKGSKIEVVLPLSIEDYLNDFRDNHSKREFEKLLGKDPTPKILSISSLKKQFPSYDENQLKKEREQRYQNAGEYIVDHCNVLIAIWDGKEAQGIGGTAHVVAYAQKTGRPLIIIPTEKKES